MPNALVEHFRSQNPDSPASDDDITLRYIEDGGLERALQYPGVADDWKRIELRMRKAYAPSLPKEFSQAFGSGVDRVQAQLYDTAALAGDLAGIPAVTRWGEAGYKRNMAEAGENAPTIRNLGEIEGVGDTARYLTSLTGSQLPQLGLTVGAAALGGLGPVGPVAGAMLGGGAAGFTQMQNRGQLLEQPGVDRASVVPTAIATGLAGSALEMLPVGRFLGKVFKPASHLAADLIPAKVLSPITRHLPNEEFGQYLGRVLQNVPEQAILEGGTEVLQELTTMAGELYANRNNPQFQLTQDQIFTRLLESGVPGAILGGAMGGIESIPKPPGAPDTTPPPPPVVSSTTTATPPPTLTPEQLAEMQGRAKTEGDALVDEILGRANTSAASSSSAAPPAAAGATAALPNTGWDISDPDNDLDIRIGGQFAEKVQQRGYSAGEAAASRVWVDELFGAADERTSVADLLPVLDKILNTKFPQKAPDVTPASSVTSGPAAATAAPAAAKTPTSTAVTVPAATPTAPAAALPPISGDLSDAYQLFLLENKANAALLQRRFDMSRPKALKIVDQLEELGYIGKLQKDGSRSVTVETPGATTTITTTPKTLAEIKAQREQRIAAEQQASESERLANEIADAREKAQRKAEQQAEREAKAFRLAEEKARKAREVASELERNVDDVLAVADAKTKAATVTKPAVPTPAAPAPMQTVALHLDDVDFEGGRMTDTPKSESALTDEDITGEEEAPKKREAQAAFYLLEGDGLKGGSESAEEYIERIGKKLISETGAKGKNTITRRIAFFENQETGEVVGYPIYATYDGGVPKYRVAGTTLDKFIAKGNVPVASFKTKFTTSAKVKGNENPVIFRYPDYAAFQKKLINPAIAKQKETAETAAAVMEKMQAKGHDSKGNALEFAGQREATETKGNQVLNFQAALFTELGGDEGMRQLITGSDIMTADPEVLLDPATQLRALEAIQESVEKLAKLMPDEYLVVASEVLKDEKIRDPIYGKGAEQQRQLLLSAISGEVYEQIFERLTGKKPTEIAAALAGDGSAAGSSPASSRPAADAGGQGAAATENTEATKGPVQGQQAEEVTLRIKPPESDEMGLRRRYVDWLKGQYKGENIELLKDGSMKWDDNITSPEIVLDNAKQAEADKQISFVDSTKTGTKTETSEIDEDGLASLSAEQLEEAAPGRATTGDIKRRMNLVQAAAERNGMKVDIVKAVTKETGLYRDKKRKIILALHDAQNPTPEGLRLMLHEVAHDVSAALPDNIRTVVHQAIASRTDEQLGITQTKDPRINQANTGGLTEPILNEERLAESLAMRGLNQELSRTLAARIVRLVKELYYDVAMAMQKLFGRTPSRALAEAYVRNRFDRVTSGDRVSQSRAGSGNKAFLGSGQIKSQGLTQPEEQAIARMTDEARGKVKTEYPTASTFLEALAEFKDQLRPQDKVLYGELVKAFEQFKINPKIKLVDWIPEKEGITKGYYQPFTGDGIEGNTIVMSRLANQLPNSFSRILVHEGLHAATYHAIKYASDYADIMSEDRLPPPVEKRVLGGVKKLQKIFDQILAEGRNLDAYGMENLDEFVSEAFSNPNFQKFLATFPSTEKGFKNLFQQFLAAIKEMFGLPERTALDDVITVSGKIFAGPEVFASTYDDMDGPRSLDNFLIPPNKGSAYSDGDELYSLPNGTNQIGERLDPKVAKVISETTIAGLNERKDFEANQVKPQLQSVPSAVSAAASQNIPVEEWFRKTLRLDDPQTLIDEEAKRVDPTTGLLLNPDQSVKVSSFAAKENRQLAAQAALEAIFEQHSKIQSRIAEFRKDERLYEATRAKAAAAHQVAVNSPVPANPKDAARRLATIARHATAAQAAKDVSEEARTKAEAAEAVVGLWRKKENELMGPLGAYKPFVFGQDAETMVPQRPNATGPGDGFMPLKIKLNHGNITKPAEIQDAIDKMSDWLEEPGRVHDGLYYTVKHAQRELLIHGKYSTDARNVDNSLTGILTGSMSEMAKSLGTTQWRIISQMINRFTEQQKFLRAALTPMARTANHFKHQAINALGPKIRPEFYMNNFYTDAINFLESRRDIVEKHPGSFKQQMDAAMALLATKYRNSTTLGPYVSGDSTNAGARAAHEQKFMAALRHHVEAEWEISKFLREHTVEAGNISVRDRKLGDMERAHIQRGIVTMPRRISQTLDRLFNVMSEAPFNWAAAKDAFKGIAGLYNQFGPQEVSAMLQPYFANADIQRDFFRALVDDTGTFSLFPAPRLQNGTQPEANPAFARQAYQQSGGDPVKFFELLYDMHGGQTDKGEYIQDGMEIFSQVFDQMRRIREQIDPEGMKVTKDLKTMIPGLMINGREISHLPAGWFEHMSFDPSTIGRVTDRVAAQSAFGHQNERLVKAYGNGVEEFKGQMTKLKDAQDWVDKNVASKDRKAIKAALAQQVGGVAELERLKKLKARESIVEGTNSIRNRLVEFFNSKHASGKPEQFLQALVSMFSSLMVNQPGSAIGQLAETGSPLLAMGPSGAAFKMAGRNIAGTAKGLASSLVDAVGVDVNNNNRWDQRLRELGVYDYEAGQRLTDVMNEEGHPDESPAVRAMRKFQGIMGLSVGSGKSGSAALRLLSPFKQTNIEMHIQGTKNYWRQADEWVRKGIEWAKANPAEFKAALGDEDPRAWADRLGMSGAGKLGFAKFWQRGLDDWGLDLQGLIREGMRNEKSGKDLLSDQTLSRLQGMWIKESGSESNAATMSSSAETNSLVRFGSKLLQWAWRRARHVSGLRLDEKDQLSMKSLANNLAGLAVLGGGGLAISALVDFYNEELQGKKRNLRRLTPNQDFSNFLMSVLEHSARVGTFGGWGDITNAVVGGVTGSGDNRGVSIDQRTVFVSSLMGMIRAMNAFANQGEADYMNVIRPLLFSMGGNGALQYLQMANKAFDFDNAESRAVARTNVGNWLRVMGRELGMEVNTDQRGYSTPTPITPTITRMQLAALADNRQDFMAARAAAIARAREEGKPDPAEYVARTYAARNPLKTVFRTPITEREYRELLQAMPEQGRADVMEAINLFNRYGASMGVQPFDGKAAAKPKASQGDPFKLSDFREARDRATAF